MYYANAAAASRRRWLIRCPTYLRSIRSMDSFDPAALELLAQLEADRKPPDPARRPAVMRPSLTHLPDGEYVLEILDTALKPVRRGTGELMPAVIAGVRVH